MRILDEKSLPYRLRLRKGMGLGVQFALGSRTRNQAKLPRNIVKTTTAMMRIAVIDIHRLEVGHNHSHNLEAYLINIGCRDVNADDVRDERLGFPSMPS